MKRLLQISLDTLLISVLPIITWLLLGFIVNKDISNVFSLTYPLQFFYLLFVNIFAIGPNITAKKIKDNSVVYSNMFVGTIIVGIITIFLVLNIDFYINLMNMNKNIYHNFCIYSVIWMYFSFVIQLFTQKLYYEDNNNESNKINLLSNLSNFFLIIILSMLLENDIISIVITLGIDFIVLLYLFFKYYKKTKFHFAFKNNIKYTSFGILGNIGMFLTYGIGFVNSFSYGSKYLNAINFEGLTTDTQWDVLTSVDTAAKIDFADKKFNYKSAIKDAYKLLALLIATILIMNITLYWYFKPNLLLLVVLLLIQIIDMIVHPLISIRMSYLQINTDTKKHNIFYGISRIGRIVCSFIPSAFCTHIGQLFTMIYLYIYSKIECKNVKLLK